MKYAGRVGAALGIVVAIALFAREGFGSVFALLRVGGYGLVLAALFHAVPMAANARAWQALLHAGAGFRLSTLVVVTWMRESVNGLLPVARVGGELVAYRSLVQRGGSAAPVAASLLVDVVLSVLTQSVFTLLGIALAVDLGIAPRVASEVSAGFAALFVLGGGLVLLQRSNLVERLLAAASRILAGRWADAVGKSVRTDRAVHAIYGRRRSVASCIAWQLAGWLAGAGEVWLALFFLERQTSVEAAIVIEAFIQTIGSVAFAIPGAYGVQEGAYLLIGAALGLDGPTALALAATRRIRDLVVFVPGLAAWSWSEMRALADPRSTGDSPVA